MARPMLDDLELQQVQTIEVDGDQVWVQHGIPALEGDFLQGLGRRASQITLTGVLTGAEVADSLKKLRDKFRAAAPVDFVADIATAIRVDQVLIEEMGVRELAGRPARFEYAFTLREFTPATPTEVIIPPPPPPPPPPRALESVLEVQVIVEGDPTFDHARTVVIVDGRDEAGQPVRRTLPNDDPTVRQGNLWTVNAFPPGTYTATATTKSPALTGSATVRLPLGQTQRAIIILRQGQAIATGFMIHYTFDRAFVEPCMRAVLRQVVDFAAAHRDQKFIIVGHTDESGDDNYNQSLSERRSRAAHAFLTFGRSPADGDAAVAEWNELRLTRATGTTLTVHDSWGTREYQHMLQDLGFYNGQIDSTHNADTDQAMRDFQAANGLTVTGQVNDQTWPVLIRAYMTQDSFAIPEAQFMPNANAATGCDNGVVRWLGCGEKMTASSPHAPMCTGPDPAWRPNRRTEFLFVQASAFPCEIAQPVTFELAPRGGTGWCLGPGNPTARCCFLTRSAEEKDKFLVQPAEPGTFVVNGRIQFEDGTPLANTEYVLIAPDGEFMNGEVTCANPQGTRKGTPLAGRTDANGNLTDSDGNVGYAAIPKGPGIYTLSIAADVVARNQGEPVTAAKGPTVCARLTTNQTTLVAIVVGRAVVSVRPNIAPAGNAVVVRKPHTNPARRAVALSVNQAFTGSGTFTRSNDAIRFFDAAVGGNEITFNGVDNVFSDAQLVAGQTVFADGARASAAVDDVELRLALTVGGAPGLAATARMTAVELTVDLFMSRTDDATRPTPLPQPPQPPPVGGAPDDKWNLGRFVHVQDPGNHQGRALLVVRPVQPAGFSGDLVLRQVSTVGDNVTGLGARARLFDNEFQAPGEAAHPNPFEFNTSTIPAAGRDFWAEGAAVSAVLRDGGFQLGLRNGELDGDRVRLTVVRLRNLRADIPSTPPNTPRLGNNTVPNSIFARGTAAAPIARDYDVDFAVNTPVVLIENSLGAARTVNLSVVVEPVGVPVLWSVLRDNRPAPNGDDPRIGALSPNPTPVLTPNPANALQATLADNAVGSFHIRPFVDGNNNGQFDPTRNTEPHLMMNLVLVRVGGPGSTNNSVAHAFNIGLGSFAGGRPAPGAVFAPTSASGLQVVTGDFAGPATAGVFNDATMVVIGGGGDGLRGLDRLFAGWINNELAVATSITVPPGEDVVAEYRDAAPVPPRIHRRTSVWTSPGGQVFTPATGAPAALVAGPVLDTTNFGNEGTGGNRAVGTEGGVGPPVAIARLPHVPVVGLPPLGQTWRVQMFDSPGDSAPPAHGFFPGALSAYRFNLDFRTELCFWTNVTGAPAPTPGPITGAAPPIPDAACCLYASAQTNTWQIRISFTFAPGTGTSTPGANTILLQRDPAPNRLARLPQSEVRFPISLNLLSTDASA